MKKILVLLLLVPGLFFGQETKKDSKVKTEIKKIFKQLRASLRETEQLFLHKTNKNNGSVFGKLRN